MINQYYLKTPGEEESAVRASTGEHEGGEEHDGDAEHHGDVVTDTVDDVARDGVDEDLEKEKILLNAKLITKCTIILFHFHRNRQANMRLHTF